MMGEARSPKVFLSYAHRGTTHEPERMFRYLRAGGCDVWWDRDALTPTRNVLSVIERAIERSDCLVLLLEGAALRSPFVRLEWEHAINTGKPVIPLIPKALRRPAPAALAAQRDVQVSATHSNGCSRARLLKRLHEEFSQ